VPGYPEVFDADPLIRFSDKRQIVIWSFDLPFNIVLTVVLFFLPALLLALIASIFIGIYAVPVLPLGVGAGVWFVHSRSRRGAKTKQWQTFLDSRTAKNGVLMLAGEAMELNSNTIYELQPASVLVGAPGML
jgi:hypothetical protein